MTDPALIEAIERHRRAGSGFLSRDLSTGELHDLVITEFPVRCSGRPSELRMGARVRRREGDGAIFWVPVEDLIVTPAQEPGGGALPIVEELEKKTSFLHMAQWLFACPLGILASHGHEILGIVKARGFSEGGRYVQEYISALSKPRKGQFRPGFPGEFDENGDLSKALEASARSLDAAATKTCGIDLSWHWTRQNEEGSDAG